MKKSKHPVLVIGGGIAGATVSVLLGQAGVPVHLIEKKADIGGHAQEMGCKATNVCMRCNVCVAHEILRSVPSSPNIHLHTSTELVGITENGSCFRAELSQKTDGTTAIDVDSIVLATGYEPYNPLENSSYGYGRVTNVITGIEAERHLAKKGRIVRIDNGEPPERIAFVQCVGSRTEEIDLSSEFTDYCSTVCCSYALRIGRLMKHQAEDSQVTIFYMDIQNHGEGFDSFYKACRNDMRFVCSRPYEIAQGDNGSVRVRYATESSGNGGAGVNEEEFDMVVLSVGIRPPADAWSLADKLGVAVDEQGFFGLKGVTGLPDLHHEGIYVVGAGESPKDIAGSMAQAEAVSAVVLSKL